MAATEAAGATICARDVNECFVLDALVDTQVRDRRGARNIVAAI